MAKYPAEIEQLITAFTALPGVGRKTAERYVVWLLKQPPEVARGLVNDLQALTKAIKLCDRCFNFATDTFCTICANNQRDQTLVCVVADSTAIAALEQTRNYVGSYHVLGGTVNPLEGIGPDQLHITDLIQRVQQQGVTEVILGLNPDMAGEATALYLIEALKDTPVIISRLARGLAAGSDIEYADDVTLSSALENRKTI